MKLSFPLVLLLFSSLHLLAQNQTVGLFHYDEAVNPGYTLLAPVRASQVFLIDECGKEVHRWETGYARGNAAYLLESGELLVASRIPGPPPLLAGGGYGGIVQKLDWDSNVLWEYTYSTDSTQQHHDIEPMPNGNVLILAWKLITEAEALAAGRNPSLLADGRLLVEHIVEVQPVGTNQGNIVWEWYLWDHLIQDADPAKPDYGVVADHPERMNLNYVGINEDDWHHANSIDYNAQLDQIMISSRSNNEFFIIDHSTTTEEAAGHTGGQMGKGGDILYRWGNPRTYNSGTATDQQLFYQHDAHWIPPGLPNAGDILVFNNGNGRPGTDYTSIERITPPTDNQGHYLLQAGQAFEPAQANWLFTLDPPGSFYTAYVGGVQWQPNGNLLLCDGPDGRFIEVTQQGDIVWEYVNPVTALGIVPQEVPLPTQPGAENFVFRCYKYQADYPGLAGQLLTAGDPLEVDPYDYVCPPVGVSVEQVTSSFLISPNPSSGIFQITATDLPFQRLEVYDLSGKQVHVESALPANGWLDVSHLPKGVYMLQTENSGVHKLMIH